MAEKTAKSLDNPTERVSIFVSTPSPQSRRRSAPLLIRGRSHSLTDEDVVSTFVRRRKKAGENLKRPIVKIDSLWLHVAIGKETIQRKGTVQKYIVVQMTNN